MKSTTKTLVIVLLSAMCASVGEAHKEWVHQYQVKQAYLLLQNQMGQAIPQMSQFVGLNVNGPGELRWRTRSIVGGAWREDLEDVVWGIGSAPPPEIPCGLDPSSTHFWDADAGENSTIEIPWPGNACGGIPNAYQKVLRLLWPSTYGQWHVYYQTDSPMQWVINRVGGGTYTIPNLYQSTGAIGIAYNSLVEFYQTGNAWVVGYVGINGDWVTSAEDYRLPFLANFGQYYRDEIVWEALGRVAHLIGDMSVPAHVHNDIHPCQAVFFPLIISNGDDYELWMGGSPNVGEVCNATQSTFAAQNYTWQDALNQGGLIDVVGKQNPARYLIYSTNQVADHYGSLAAVEWGQDNPMWRPGDASYNLNHGGDHYSELQTLLGTMGNPVTSSSDYALNKAAIAEKGFVFSIRAIAGLLHWFAVETNLINRITVKNEFEGGQVKLNTQSYSSGQSFSFVNGTSIDLSNTTPQGYGGYQRHFYLWEKVNLGGAVESSSDQLTWSTSTNGQHTYKAKFRKEFDVRLLSAQYVETGGAGGQYRINNGNPVSTWTGTFIENVSSSLSLEAVPPAGWEFGYWSDGSTSKLRQPWVPSDHTDLYAVFKKLLFSTSSTATASNSQRKIVTYGTTTHMVYESGGSIWHTKTTDGTNWSSEFPVHISSAAKNPSIEVTQNTDVHIVWEEAAPGNPTTSIIKYKVSQTGGDSWPIGFILIGSGPSPATPVVAGNLYVTVVWKGATCLYARYSPLHTQSGTSGALYPMPIANTTATSRDFSVGENNYGIHIAFINGAVNAGHVYYERYSADYADCGIPFCMTLKEHKSLTLNHGWIHGCERTSIVTDREAQLWITWDGIGFDGEYWSPEEVRHLFHTHRTGIGSFGPNYGIVYGSNSHSPVFGIDNRFGASTVNMMWVYEPSQIIWNWQPFGGGKMPTMVPYTFPSTEYPPYAMWTAASGPPHQIIVVPIQGEILAPVIGGNEINSMRYPRGATISRQAAVWLDSLEFGSFGKGSVSGYLLANYEGFDVIRGGQRSRIPFRQDTSGYDEWLGSSSLLLPANADTLSGEFRITLRGFRINDPNVTLDIPVISTLISEGNSQHEMKTIRLGDLARIGSRDTVVRSRMSVPVSSLRNRSVRVRQRIIGQSNSRSPYWSEIAKVTPSDQSLDKVKDRASQSQTRDIPTSYGLHQNYPNPFNPATTIRFDITDDSHVSLKIFDMVGREVCSIVDDNRKAGSYEVSVDGAKLASGVYVYKITAGAFTESRKMVLLK